jgi:hypothetical protein
MDMPAGFANGVVFNQHMADSFPAKSRNIEKEMI